MMLENGFGVVFVREVRRAIILPVISLQMTNFMVLTSVRKKCLHRLNLPAFCDKIGQGSAGVAPALNWAAAYALWTLGGFLLPVLALLDGFDGVIQIFRFVQNLQDFQPFSLEQRRFELLQLNRVHAFADLLHVVHLLQWFAGWLLPCRHENYSTLFAAVPKVGLFG